MLNPTTANPTSTAQGAVCLPAKNCNVVCCPQCGKDFEPTNRRQRFCSATCRVAAHRARERETELKFQQERRSGLGMSFDGRFNGKLRDVGRNRPTGYAARMVAI